MDASPRGSNVPFGGTDKMGRPSGAEHLCANFGLDVAGALRPELLRRLFRFGFKHYGRELALHVERNLVPIVMY